MWCTAWSSHGRLSGNQRYKTPAALSSRHTTTPAHTLTLVTDTSEATVDALTASYLASFDLASFYPATAQFRDVPDGAHWHALQLRKVAYSALVNPGHEVWAVLGRPAAGGVDGREVAALVVLKLPGCP